MKRRFTHLAVAIGGSILFWVWIYHVIIGGVSPVIGAIYTAVVLAATLLLVVIAALWKSKFSKRSGK